MSSFFDSPILNSPYSEPARHWELDSKGQPTEKIIERRRPTDFITPIAKPQKQNSQMEMDLRPEEAKNISTDKQKYDAAFINAIRLQLEKWKNLPKERWNVTPQTARLLEHWRHYNFNGLRPFFCQIEAAETLIYLTEAAPHSKEGRNFLERIRNSNAEANPELFRIALKMATGAGKTTVMAMLIAWQTVNAVRHPGSKNFTRCFLVVTPGITIKDRLRVLLPNDVDAYYGKRELVPSEMLPDIQKAKIVVSNYHNFMLREKMELSAGGRRLLQGRGKEIETKENPGQMLQRVCPEFLSTKNIMVINDEAHHCYREKVSELADRLDDESKENNEAARVWISGLEIVQKKIGIKTVVDLSATPFFLKGSGYDEGTLFPWTVSDFSLMDAIECGIVKLPRVPIVDNVSAEIPKYRNLWEHIGKKMPKKGGAKNDNLDPLALPAELQGALESLYGHYEKVFALWEGAGIKVPPCFIIVCNNTSTSKLLFDYVAGFKGHNGRLLLFSNFDDNMKPLSKPNTILIDSLQLENGEKLSEEFIKAAGDEIALFKDEIFKRTGNSQAAENLKGSDILREAMNTVGKEGKLGEGIRCVVSVSMLTEGWDANTVTHILGIRAFGTQLLCEQVVGRALRRQSYELNENGLLNPEYADIFGIPFDFTAKPTISKLSPPAETVRVFAMSERERMEINFPRVAGYRTELPKKILSAKFTEDSVYTLTPEMVGPTITKNAGIVGKTQNFTVERLGEVRCQTVIMKLTQHLLETKFKDGDGVPELYLYGQLKSIVEKWFLGYFKCTGGAKPAQLLYLELANEACNRIFNAINSGSEGGGNVKITLDPYNPEGSTRNVNFTTSKKLRFRTSSDKCHINLAVLDSEWESEFCRVAENCEKVLSYAKNQGMGFEVPYLMGSAERKYTPDFILLIGDGKTPPLHLVVEIKGFKREDAKAKKQAMETFWISGVNNSGEFGRWAFAEFTSEFEMEKEFGEMISSFIKQGVCE
jgi:type III restriction enzyme